MGKTSQGKQHVFIIGSKGIPARYGGFEAFVDNLTYFQKSSGIKYHVSCLVDPSEYDATKQEFEHNGAHCFNIKDLNVGASKAIFYDLNALKYCLEYIKKNNIDKPVIYVLACRIGPFIGYYKRKIKDLGGQLYVNPDGHEWKRAKWSVPVRKYWKISEQLMVKHSDLLVCDSKNIEKYIKEDYKSYNPNTTFIAYGAKTSKSNLADSDSRITRWYNEKDIKPNEYYLVVGRFVPENNYEIMVREFMKSNTTKDFVLITGIDGNPFYEKLETTTRFSQDNRIKFVGTVYDQELLKKIRENAYGYFHGHEVGGTNPSLLEALASTDLNLLLDVGFNYEVAENSALYWSKEDCDLSQLINKADKLSSEKITELGVRAKSRISKWYNWEYIVDKYETIFLNVK